jgi:hypothetical protein
MLSLGRFDDDDDDVSLKPSKWLWNGMKRRSNQYKWLIYGRLDQVGEGKCDPGQFHEL